MGFRLKLVADILKEIEDLHVQTYNQTGKLSGNAFFQQRRVLFDRLDAALGTLARKHIVYSDEMRMRHALGISSKSIVHRWRRQGGPATGIPEFERLYLNQARLATFMRQMGYVGISLDVFHSYQQLHEACTVDNNDLRCTRRKYIEAGRLPLSIGGGIGGGLAGYSICGLLFAAPSAGTSLLWCGVLVGGVGAYAGGYLGSWGGGVAGEYVFERNYPTGSSSAQ